MPEKENPNPEAKNPEPKPKKQSREQRIAELVAAKIKAGLPRSDAEEVAKRQVDEDDKE